MFKSLVLLAALLASAPISVGAQTVTDEEAIRRTRMASNEAIARHDVAGIVSFLDDEFHVTAGSGAFIQGAEAMGAAFAQQFESYRDVRYVRTPESVEVSESGRIAAEAGTWVGTWIADDGPVRMGGSYSAYWRKDASWVIRSELFVTLFCEGSGCS